MNKRRRIIVLCASMKVKDKVIEVAQILKKMGHTVLLPVECMQGLPKEIASRAHFDRIVNPDNDTVLIVNATINGIDNYIGPNSFAEIAFAFYHRKDIFLLNDVYEPYLDELNGWHVKTLKGNLDLLNKGEEKMNQKEIIENLIEAFKACDIALATQNFINPNNDEITNGVRAYLDTLLEEDTKKVLAFLNHLLNVCYDYSLYEEGPQENDHLITELDDKKKFYFKENVIYYIGRLKVLPDIEILKKAYFNEKDMHLALNLTYSSLATFDETIEMDFIKRFAPGNEYDVMLRSWTLAFFKGVPNPYDYVDDGTSWEQAKNPRLNRLKINDDTNPKFNKAMAFRLFDLLVLNLFLDNRDETLPEDEKEIVNDALIDYEKYSEEKIEKANELKRKIVLR